MDTELELFNKILKTAVEGGASDVHIKINTPVVYRISRELVAVECPYPSEEWMRTIAYGITPKHLHKKMEDDREIDFSYHVVGVGRFRTNLFQQRGTWCL